MCFGTVHMIMESHDSPEFGAKVNAADLIVPDGMPLVWMQRLRGRKNASRVRANDLMILLCDFAEKHGLRVGFYGGKQEVIDAIVDRAGFRALAIDTEPAALLRSYAKQFRRDNDKSQRAMFVRLGTSHTTVVIAQDTEVFFVKYLDVGGDQMDEAVSRHLNIPLEQASTLRRNNGDRRAEQQDSELARSVSEATRPVLERLAGELSLCIRYHSVTFRGQPLSRVVFGGNEAVPGWIDALGMRVDAKCELGDPLRSFEPLPSLSRRSQWDVVTGLALKPLL